MHTNFSVWLWAQFCTMAWRWSGICPNNLVKWLASYLHGRLWTWHYNDSLSAFHRIHAGVSQGLIIAPCLFNHYALDYPLSSQLILSYADDFTTAASSDYWAASAILTNYTFDIAEWARSQSLSILVTIGHSSPFTCDTHKLCINPGVFIICSTLFWFTLSAEAAPGLWSHFQHPLNLHSSYQLYQRAISSMLHILEALTGAW